MRIRRKKHLDERLSGVKDYVIVPDKSILNVKEAVKFKEYLDYSKLFGNDNPVNLEVGCGKGGFIINLAKKYPNENFLAVELLENIIVMAAEHAKGENLKNLFFINSGAEYLPRYIKENSISKIFLNFSPPFPQKGSEGRRLTCDRCIQNYKDFLTKDGFVFQKTDDKDFYDYSFGQFEKFNFDVKDVSNLIENGNAENIVTEYESKFRALNMPIYCLYAKVSK
ncbi:MAG: tRNA (guanosine(46)-N7)-methyltransferase TrmB [Clostridia bacterium]|nr:tRNA (guanosine(46)-N7)-methyltransferase TrmB [Clostridia bacterium]